MLRDTDWADAWAAATMWDAEGFVQVQMADVGTDVARPAKTDLRVHIRAVHVNLTAVTVHDEAERDGGDVSDLLAGIRAHPSVRAG